MRERERWEVLKGLGFVGRWSPENKRGHAKHHPPSKCETVLENLIKMEEFIIVIHRLLGPL